jgi:transcriptional regulator with XRE-family HTH domain
VNGRDLRTIRRLMGLSQPEFGQLLGLAPTNADRMVRRWEDSAPTGPAAVAAAYIAPGVLDDTMKPVTPEYVIANPIPPSPGGADREMVIRLWYPRFLAVVVENEILHPDLEAVPIPGDEETSLAVAMWMDPVAQDVDTRALLARGAAAYQIDRDEIDEADGYDIEDDGED